MGISLRVGRLRTRRALGGVETDGLMLIADNIDDGSERCPLALPGRVGTWGVCGGVPRLCFPAPGRRPGL